MKNYFPLLIATLLFISCSSDDDHSNDHQGTTNGNVKVELNRLTDHSDDFENSSVMLSFIGDENLEIQADIPLDSTFIGDQEGGLAGKEFYYSFSELEESITFETTKPAMPGGVFYFETFKKEGVGETGDLYTVKVYHGDELYKEETISELTEIPETGKVFGAFNTTEEPEF